MWKGSVCVHWHNRHLQFSNSISFRSQKTCQRKTKSECKLCVFLDLFLKCKLLSKEEKEKKIISIKVYFTIQKIWWKKSSMKRTHLYLSFHQKSKKCYRKGLFGKRVFCMRVCERPCVCFLVLQTCRFFLNTVTFQLTHFSPLLWDSRTET